MHTWTADAPSCQCQSLSNQPSNSSRASRDRTPSSHQLTIQYKRTPARYIVPSIVFVRPRRAPANAQLSREGRGEEGIIATASIQKESTYVCINLHRQEFCIHTVRFSARAGVRVRVRRLKPYSLAHPGHRCLPASPSTSARQPEHNRPLGKSLFLVHDMGVELTNAVPYLQTLQRTSHTGISQLRLAAHEIVSLILCMWSGWRFRREPTGWLPTCSRCHKTPGIPVQDVPRRRSRSQ